MPLVTVHLPSCVLRNLKRDWYSIELNFNIVLYNDFTNRDIELKCMRVLHIRRMSVS